MTDLFHAVVVLIGAAFAVGCCAAALTFAVATVCRWLEWSPVNITINYNDYRTSGEE